MADSEVPDASVDDEVPEGTWTVARLNREIQSALSDVADRFPTHVVGEVAEIDEYPFGAFFELRDLEDEPSISCIAWSGAMSDFDHELTEGTKAVVEAEVDFYPERGDCQLQVADYWPLGESARQQEFEALRTALDEEGLFDEERKQPIPPHPGCIGLVTSPSGSAREDCWSAITKRSPRTDVKLYGATVQGEAAVPSLIEGLNRLDADPDVETIIVTRGGGSDVDLWCFNAEPLVRCIAACATPTVVAIGHEDDETLVEFVADDRAMTPTEAGVLATTHVKQTVETLGGIERRLSLAYRSTVDDRLDDAARRIETAHERLEQRVARRESRYQRSRDLEQRVTTAYETLVETRLDGIETEMDRHLQDLEHAAATEAATAEAARSRVSDLEARIDAAYETHVSGELETLERRIDDAYRAMETEQRVEAGTAEARRLRIAVAVLLAVLLGETLLILVFVL